MGVYYANLVEYADKYAASFEKAVKSEISSLEREIDNLEKKKILIKDGKLDAEMVRFAKQHNGWHPSKESRIEGVNIEITFTQKRLDYLRDPEYLKAVLAGQRVGYLDLEPFEVPAEIRRMKQDYLSAMRSVISEGIVKVATLVFDDTTETASFSAVSADYDGLIVYSVVVVGQEFRNSFENLSFLDLSDLALNQDGQLVIPSTPDGVDAAAGLDRDNFVKVETAMIQLVSDHLQKGH
ncbi:hypothetical protein [Marinobacter bryozoorum]|uniref:hypothetical protein n=1 Tax=Marinobacter bryozoorum TaxID=256324 RepID=UPI0020061888|nr:hypothetical protein [Marinobacter bryozoorum]